ncbi:MAG: nucleotidyltransferase family protein [Bacilli bacterium]|nr:nucleotidyltransferase family protein [Bacilli bacterium]
MYNSSQKFIIDLVNNRLKDEYIEDLDIDYVLSFLIENKIFLRYYIKLIKNINVKNKKTLIKAIYDDYIYGINEKNELAFKIVEIFNKNNISYILYKGLILNYLLYENNNCRIYNDIDIILLEQDDLNKVVNILNKYFILDIYDINSFNSLNKELQITIWYKKNKFTLELKNIKKTQILFNDKSDLVELKNYHSITTFNYEMTFLNLVNYFSYYISNINSILFSHKIIMKYIVEINDFLNNHNIIMDYEKLKNKININKMENKIVNCLELLSEVFLNSSYEKYIYKLSLNNVRTKKDLEINFMNYYLNNNEIIDFIKAFFYDKYIFNFSEKNNKYSGILLLNKKKIICNYSFSEIFTITYDNMAYDKFIIYFQIYGYDNYNEYIKPYYPIFIHKDNDGFKITKSLYPRNISLFRSDIELRSETINNVDIKMHGNDLSIKINFSQLLNIKKNIGINFIIYLIDDFNNVFDYVEFLPYNSSPLIIN